MTVSFTSAYDMVRLRLVEAARREDMMSREMMLNSHGYVSVEGKAEYYPGDIQGRWVLETPKKSDDG